ncbi:MAG TPA: cytochrome c peroxidase [Gemmatimonadaceae bacterium]|nr:cytochrome c peroxidase [Gemmatimonadaceae bacterium]
MHRRQWLALAVTAGVALSLVRCADQQPTAPVRSPDFRHVHQPPSSGGATTPEMVRQLAAERGITPLHRAPHVRESLVKLGQALAFDPILSGNHDVSCMTCHLPGFETGDGRSLSIGAGGSGLGPSRTHPDGVFIPRNAPPLFDAGALRHMFWDGRVEADEHGQVHTPAGAQFTPAMQRVMEFGAVSAQPMFPPAASTEMRGVSGNELAAISADDYTDIWAGLMRRLGAIPEYRKMFEKAYPGTRFRDMNFAYASNAIAGFLVDKLTFSNTPWDRFLRGQDRALTPQQLEGARSFLTLKCSVCHTGPTLSDDKFHDVDVAQIGPGQNQGMLLHEDFGRMNVTGDPADRYRFRTSPLRNVELTAPYGHDGAIMTLRDFVAHYSNSDSTLRAYDPSQLEPDLRSTLVPDVDEIIAQRDTLLDGVVLTPALVDNLVAYMQALTDPAARDLSRFVPRRVPSGLPVGQPTDVAHGRRGGAHGSSHHGS